MGKKKEKTALQKAQETAQKSIIKTNEKIGELGECVNDLSIVLDDMQCHFDAIRRFPDEHKSDITHAQELRLNWKQQAELIQEDYEKSFKRSVGGGATGAGVGVAVAAMGPTAAMGVATTFGVASTGTAISTLSGAAATNAALAWLGGGALAAGGGGMVAGEALLALAGPVGWSIAAVAVLSSGVMLIKNVQDKKRLEELFTLISKRDIKTHKLAIVEMNERIKRIQSEIELLRDGLDKLKSFGLDYSKMTERQQYELGAYVNFTSSATLLLTEPIAGLQPKYTEEDYYRFLSIMYREGYPDSYLKNKDAIVFLANLLFKIELNKKDIGILGRSFKADKKLLESLNTTKKDFDVVCVGLAVEAIEFKYVT